jgi:hypothetical protein
MPFLPNLPFVPAFLRRPAATASPLVVVKPEPWPANPATYDDDLLTAQKNEALLAAQLKKARQLLDESESARLLREAQDAYQEAAAEVIVARAQRDEARTETEQLRDDVEALRLQLKAMQRQLDDALGYDDAIRMAIKTRSGQPIHKG